MKQVININFQGRVVPIEVTAFDLLKAYTESLNRHFASEEGKDEIINDIESRIGELFQERLTNGATCITDDDVAAVIKSMGRPEDFETGDDGAGATSAKAAEPSANQYSGSADTHRRLYRDESNKVLGGVCAGVANYFGIDTTLVRIIFILSGVGFFAYILLWAFVPSNSGTVIGGIRKKLYRDGDDKIIAGVCSGIGNYFGINPWIPRVLFALPFLSFVFRWGHWGMMDFPNFLRVGFSPGALIIYIILWLVIPEALTTAEKLEMKGEKIDVNSIKESVREEMKGVQQRAEKFGKEAKAFAQEKGKAMTAEAGNIIRRSRSSLGDIIALAFRIFAYFIVGCVAFGLVAALFALAVFSISIFPYKNYVLVGDWQNLFAWGTLLFFIMVPVISIITWIIRRLARIKKGSRIMRLSFISLWIIGWVCFFALASSVVREFQRSSKLPEETIILTNPTVNKLLITSSSSDRSYYHNRWLRFEPFEALDEDTAYVKNVEVQIARSDDDSFHVTMLRISRGTNVQEANRLASMIQFNIVQKDSVLRLDKGIAINQVDKFRNQHVIVTVYVPVGKQIRIDNNLAWWNRVRFSAPFIDDDFNIEVDNQEHNWGYNEDYRMTKDSGLVNMRGISIDRDKNRKKKLNNYDNADDNSNYRYDNPVSAPMNKVDSMKEKQEKEKQKLNDSLQKAKEKIERQLEKLNDNTNEPSSVTVYKVPGYGPLMNIN